MPHPLRRQPGNHATVTIRTHWSDAVIRALVRPAQPADAAAAAAGLLAAHTGQAAVILFTAADRCVTALAVRDETGDVDEPEQSTEEISVCDLFSPERLAAQTGVADRLDIDTIRVWPELLAVCVSGPDCGPEADGETAVEAARLILGQARSRQILLPQHSHLEAMAEFAAGAGHEINNPLGSIIGRTRLLLQDETRADRRQALGVIGSQAWRIRDMIGDCMLFARPPQPEFEDCCLNDLIPEAAGRAVESMEQPATCLNVQVPESPTVISVDPNQMRTLITHLVRNSIEAASGAGRTPRISVSVRPEADAVCVTVEDSGPGVTDEAVNRHLFDPFFSGRQAGRGIGFGLSVCWQIVRRHHGLILAESPDGGGFRVVTVLPKQQPA